MADAEKSPRVELRHTLTVRVTHWLTVLGICALLLTGVEILLSHPRLYWGETGNVNMKPLFVFPVPASRAAVPTAYGYVLPDQNGWSRALHFEAAWLLVLVGLWYVASGLACGHVRRKLWPARGEWGRIGAVLKQHLRLQRPEAGPYNVLQKLTYLGVVFGLAPLAVWTGLAMSPGLVASMPFLVTTLGGQQTARTIHFFTALALVGFVLGHVAMVAWSGWRARVASMVTGRAQ